ncbi:hypothetical protein SLEP1_g1174 [Rubroshorea leprosula]|uniref:Uncharacterized protein n=1 Tax=Rubroshorea leprosula TaxID=152421 RepID=A0AAV5HJS9_9ROSI|nr:hypothetical protein SLEP1_g1174 [Rubroshorea leprosula]
MDLVLQDCVDKVMMGQLLHRVIMRFVNCSLRRVFSTAMGLHGHYKRDHAALCKVCCDNCFNYFENQTMLTMQLMGGCVLEQYYRDDNGDDSYEDSEDNS